MIDDEVLTAQQACRLLGISVWTLNRAIARGELRFFTTPGGKLRRFYRSDIEKMRRPHYAPQAVAVAEAHTPYTVKTKDE